MTGLPQGDTTAAATRARAFSEIGVTALVCGGRYSDAAAFEEMAEGLGAVRRELAKD